MNSVPAQRLKFPHLKP